MSSSKIEFYGGRFFVAVPIIVFLIITVYLFIFEKAFDMTGLAMGGFLGLVAGAFFSKNWVNYWNGAISGIATELTGVLVCILVFAGIFSDMMKAGGIASGFVWLGVETGITGALFCAFTFIATAIIATATGTSIGTIFTAVPVFFAAGVQLGGDPAMLAGAILSGAIFGDNLAPVSDVTVISASTQTYQESGATAEVGGVVVSRTPYAIIAALLTIPFYLILGGSSNVSFELIENASPTALIMLLPVIVLVVLAIITKNIFQALIVGIITGVVVGLLAGRFELSQVLLIKDGNVSGFIYGGISHMTGTIMLCLSLFAVIGIFEKSGALDAITNKLLKSEGSITPRRTETVLAIGSLICSTLFAGVTSAALIMFGPIGDKVGKQSNLHPFRRSHIMSSMANSIPVLLPFSAFVFIVMSAVKSQVMGDVLTPFTLLYSALYPWALFVVFSVSIYTGWGRRFEGKNRASIKQNSQEPN
ncbi:Na+/H+ antiporter NhaC family protein [Zophobihabitans entericus]|uniref:Na+/H+ antiporter NhaC family protein n=1 Tax=Zophobihabitans entericus TaxID=1635327 RepID=A0A6G9ICX7_9GAMM|nr:Na+/H+ antiporter NhaC family protein [Zophobihabitans entericus]QIQ22088.1 Na+/H+ antiporter NhaC family protein [Zophobihabitans entericus]